MTAPTSRIAFVDRELARFADALDPEGRDYLLAVMRAADEVRRNAAATRTRRRDDLIIALVRQCSTSLSKHGAALELVGKAETYLCNRWQTNCREDRRPVSEPERSIHRILELNGGKFPSVEHIRKLL